MKSGNLVELFNIYFDGFFEQDLGIQNKVLQIFAFKPVSDSVTQWAGVDVRGGSF